MSKLAARRNKIFMLAGAASVSLVLAAISGVSLTGKAADERAGVVVLPEFSADVTSASVIDIQTREETYQLARDNEGWFMEQRGRFPIRRQALADLSEALSAMVYTREMTQDPRKFDQLGLGDPREGGAGALMRVSNDKGEQLVDLIVGFKTGKAYVRHPDEQTTWAVDTTAFPPLQRAARWLDLYVIDLPESAIAQVEVTPWEGETYTLLAKEDEVGEFKLAPPFQDVELISDYAANPPAIALSRFAPIDVIPLEDLDAESVGVHRTLTYAGLMIEAEMFARDERYWVVFSEGLEQETQEAQNMLEDLETKLVGWAFEISRMDYAIMTTPLEDIIVGDLSDLETP